MKKTMFCILSILMLSTSQLSAAWRTCVPSLCSQKQATFDTWRECASYQRYMGSSWSKCFEV